MKKKGLLLFGVAFSLLLTGCGQESTYKKGQKLLQEGNYTEAVKKFEEVSTFEDASKYIQYCNALLAVNDGNYSDAVITFETLGDFSDSDYLEKYYTAYALEQNAVYSDYLQAKEIYGGIPLFKDSKERIEAVDDEIEQLYQNGLKMIEDGKYQDGYELLASMDGYSDSANQIILGKNKEGLELLDKGEFSDGYSILYSIYSEYPEAGKTIVSSHLERATEAFDNKQFDEGEEILDKLNNYYQIDKIYFDGLRDVRLYGKYKKAIDLKENEKFEEALGFFEYLSGEGYEDSAKQISECEYGLYGPDYETALTLENEGKYEEAIEIFSEITDYSDSEEQIEICEIGIKDNTYDEAIALKEDGRYEEAIETFKEIEDYKDSKEQIVDCKYEEAIELKENGKYVEAIQEFEELDGYKESAEQIEECKVPVLKKAEVGDVVWCGKYEQDNDASNGKEDIEWIVLEKSDDKLLMISKYALDVKPYNEEYETITWEECSLRTWMNKTFINEVFSEEESKMMLDTEVPADENPEYSTNPGKDTTDKIFLLSIPEVEKYFANDEERKCVPTEYAIAQGAWTCDSETSGGKATCWWWLRSPGLNDKYTAGVNGDGSVSFKGLTVYDYRLCVRPALWINLAS